MYYIYAYQNKVDGKVYIGQTNNLIKRDKSHINNTRNNYIDNAIRKYGRHNFDYWAIQIVDSIDQAYQEEVFWIAEMRNQLGIDMVYNIANGGESSMRGRKHSLDALKKMSEAHMGEKNHNYGKRFPGLTNSGSFTVGNKPKHNHAGKTWKVIDGKRMWIAR